MKQSDPAPPSKVDAFIEASVVAKLHRDGDVQQALGLLEAHPGILAASSIHAAVMAGALDDVSRLLDSATRYARFHGLFLRGK